MKKILIITLLLISCGIKAQTAATSNNQNIEIGKLQLILGQLQAGITASAIPSSVTTRTLSSSIVTTGSASIPTGASSISFITSSAFTGSINGIPYDPNFNINFKAPNYDLLPAIIYTITTGSITLNILK